MKTLLNIRLIALLAITLMLSSFEARAFGDIEVFIEENSKVVYVKFENPAKESLDLILLDERDRVIKQNEIGNLSNLEYSYDFSDLTDGNYTLVSELNNMRYNKVIEVRDSRVRMINNFYTFAPEFKLQDDKILVHYILNGDRNISISIDKGSETIFDSYFDSNEPVFSKAFAINRLESGSYTLQFASQEDFYSFEFEVD